MKKDITSENEMRQFGVLVAKSLEGGEIIELVGDVGAGKTTLTRSIARTLGVEGPIQSPTFTISNRYQTSNGLELVHYDFYRLQEAGIMSAELEEVITGTHTITVIEWAEVVSDMLDADRLTVHIEITGETARQVILQSGGDVSKRLLEALV
jgi:tRNA threonylcarbamoyladenosine biosynthesis protein TsaE